MATTQVAPLQSILADLHIHIGRSRSGLPVKITASRNMTFTEVVYEAAHHKGLQLIGVIDAQSPPVQQEILQQLETGIFTEHPDGGIVYQDVTCLLGAEIEVKEPGMKPAHLLAYFPKMAQIIDFTKWLSKHMKNTQLSTQRLYQSAQVLADEVGQREGLLIPAHIFTPFKSVLGSATDHLANLLPLEKIAAVELGLSSDTNLADEIGELHSFPYLTNSDAHSLPNIGREYNQFQMREASFAEFRKVLTQVEGRKVLANYGLNPKLGKYYRSRCLSCDTLWPAGRLITSCPICGREKKVRGVRDRIDQLADNRVTPPMRPPYIYQIPLRMFPKLGPKTLEKLYQQVGTEMVILHQATHAEIASTTNQRLADQIILAREQGLELIEGGGGRYGRIKM